MGCHRDNFFKVSHIQKGDSAQNTVTFCGMRLPKNKSCISYSSMEPEELQILLEHMQNCKELPASDLTKKWML